MEKVKKRKAIVRAILQDMYDEWAQNPNKDVRPILIEDPKTGHFLFYLDGWYDGRHRIYGPSVHVEVKDDGKVWLHHDGTDEQVGQAILDKGVPKNQLVPAFQPPHVRPDMVGFAVA